MHFHATDKIESLQSGKNCPQKIIQRVQLYSFPCWDADNQERLLSACNHVKYQSVNQLKVNGKIFGALEGLPGLPTIVIEPEPAPAISPAMSQLRLRHKLCDPTLEKSHLHESQVTINCQNGQLKEYSLWQTRVETHNSTVANLEQKYLNILEKYFPLSVWCISGSQVGGLCV